MLGFKLDQSTHHRAGHAMKITNFKLIGRTGYGPIDWVVKASVTVETGFIFKKRADKIVVNHYASSFWFFEESGKFTPAYSLEELARSYESVAGKDLWHIEIQPENQNKAGQS